jgi:hypothetical protein
VFNKKHQQAPEHKQAPVALHRESSPRGISCWIILRAAVLAMSAPAPALPQQEYCQVAAASTDVDGEESILFVDDEDTQIPLKSTRHLINYYS